MKSSLLPPRTLWLSLAAGAALVLTPRSAQAGAPRPPAMIAVASVSSDAASASWNDIKDIVFAARSEFETGLDRLAARIELQIQELEAKRATLKSDPTAWDFAMKEMRDSRAFFRSLASDVRKATTESTWNDLKEKVGLAWERSQDAYDKVKASTTS
ncbi:MAG: hypothetical protein JNN01_03245 [Opitutaceae bacterium]|nr:hypothetical protein [Opitutaceae bacterium]